MLLLPLSTHGSVAVCVSFKWNVGSMNGNVLISTEKKNPLLPEVFCHFAGTSTGQTAQFKFSLPSL